MSVRLTKDYEPIPGYRLIERLGRGGFGEVWKVEAPGQLFKAMKFVFGNLDSQDDSDGRPAEQELKALNRVKSIRHPYILSLERIDIIDGQLLIVMELADKSLWDQFREYRQRKQVGIPREELLLYMIETAEALDLMNDSYHIQHLDVKPQNLFLVYNHVKVADFGLAKAFEGGRGTITGGVTPVYAAPETFEGYASRFTDQYSLAICFQELLTGTRPFNGSNTKQLLMQHLNGVPDLNALPPADRPIIAKALNKKPDDRWPSCIAMVQALKNAHANDSIRTTPRVQVTTSSSTPIPNKKLEPKSSKLSEMLDTQRTKVGPAQVNAFARGGMTGPALKTAENQSNLKLVTARDVANLNAGRPSSGLPSLRTQLAVQQVKPHSSPRQNLTAEIQSDGCLYPALIIGIGHHGRLVIQRIIQMIREEFGSLQAFPICQFLLIDTDADELAEAMRPDSENPLTPDQVYHLQMHRSAHYLQRDGLANVEAWMPKGKLYQLPREPKNSQGIRAYGRLALLDHVRPLRSRIRTIVEKLSNDDELKSIAEATQLGIRSNRIRIHLVTSSMGGTGSGMALDLAYFLKNELRKQGHTKPHVRGHVLIPAADKTKPKSISLSNTYGLLRELHHYATPGVVYHEKFDTSESPVSEGNGPFTVSQLTQLPDSPSSPRLPLVIGSVSRQIVMEMTSQLSTTADTVRDEALALPRSTGPVISANSHFRISWPRRILLDIIRFRFSHQLMQRWASKDSTALREPIRVWLNQEWQKHELDFEQVVEKLNQALEESLRAKPEQVFEAFVEPLRVSYQNGAVFNEKSACDVFEEIVRLVGGPNFDTDLVGKLDETLRARLRIIQLESDGRLSALTVSFIEQPQYRLAGAEEAILQISDRLNLTIETLENLRKSTVRDLGEKYQKLYAVMEQLAKDETGFFGKRRGGLQAEFCELLKQYPIVRLRVSILSQAVSFYRGLLSQCPEFTREINECRSKLLEFSQFFLSKIKKETIDEPMMPIIPEGCETLADAADEFIESLPSEELLEFENSLQRKITHKLRGIVNVTMKKELLEDFIAIFEKKAIEFIEPQLESENPAKQFFHYLADSSNIEAKLCEAFDIAAPELTSISGAAPAEATILAAPQGEDGDRLRKYFMEKIEGVEFIPSTNERDIVLYREYPLLELAMLPQTASHAYEAYEAKLDGEQPPHSRYDIAWSSVINPSQKS